MQTIEPLDPTIAMFLRLVGINNIEMIQKPPKLKPKISELLFIYSNNTNKDTINIIINNELRIILHKNQNNILMPLIKQGGKGRKKKQTRKTKSRSRKNKKKKRKTKKKMTGGNNYFNKYLKPILLFITLFCFITMQSNQDPDIISRTEYNERIKNWDPTEINQYIDTNFQNQTIEGKNNELINYWTKDGKQHNITPSHFSREDAAIVATINLQGYTNQFMEIFSHPELLFPGPEKIGTPGIFPAQGLSRYFLVHVDGTNVKIIDRAYDPANMSDKDVEKRRFFSIPTTSEPLNKLIENAVIEQVKATLHTAHMENPNIKEYWVAFIPMKLPRKSLLVTKLGQFITFLTGKSIDWHTDPIPFLENKGPSKNIKGEDIDYAEYTGDTFTGRSRQHLTKYSALMTFTYAKDVKKRSEARIINDKDEEFIIKNTPETFPPGATKVYNTIAKDRFAIGTHDFKADDNIRPVISLYITPKSNDTEVMPKHWQSI